MGEVSYKGVDTNDNNETGAHYDFQLAIALACYSGSSLVANARRCTIVRTNFVFRSMARIVGCTLDHI